MPELVALGSAAENAGFDLLANTARDRFLWPGSDPQDEDPELGRITRAYEDSSNKKSETTSTSTLTNADIAELLAMAAESAKQPIQKALRRASRKSLLWPEEAATLIQQRRSLEELPGIGPSLSRIVKRWLNDPPEIVDPPAIRKGFQTILQARAILDANPTWRTVKGDLQMHTLWSDGTASVAEMAQAAVEYGHEYVAITDHAKGLKIAGGINENQLAEQSDEIAKLNEQMAGAKKPLRVLRSVELNLNVAGEGDMEPQALAKLDVVLGCFHSALRKKEDQTERYLAALRNPTIQILGHPRGRIYNFRLGLTADWRRVFDAAAELDKAVEIDCYPDRQDISPDLLKLAAKAGCRISLGTDSHGPSQLRFIELGLAAAMTAKIKRDRILNFTSAAELLEWVGRVRQSSGTYLH